ncbi:MAG: tripartite tricarboxylate transporter permease [Candidatus Diapherotrites archaeon]|nr:tripartite tricarboxylate transporter permease [Candidatus Diapherotrites archaeon]
MIELLLYVLAGCFLGVATGLTPGLHVNTLAFVLLLLFGNAPTNIVALIVAMAITHSFFDFLPSIVLGAPDSESYLSILPGHRYLLRGQAYKALMLTIIGGLLAGFCGICAMPIFLFVLPKIEWLLPKLVPALLSAVLIVVILFSKRRRKTFTAMFLSAALGLIVLKRLSIQNGIMAIVIGLFSLSTLVLSLMRKPKVRKQELAMQGLNLADSIKGSMLAMLGSATIAIMPGIGPSQAAFLLRKISGKLSSDCYLTILGGINTCNIIFSLFVLYAIGKTRTGIALAIKNLAVVDSNMLVLFAGSALIAIAFSTMSLQSLGRWILRNIHRFSYMKLNATILALLLVFLMIFCGTLALFVSLIACSIGCYAALNKVARSSCMAFLIVPTILIYLGL